jgi:2-(1,2-epoxy-1,2-dihydrophenyl)acetyl-CoA isomerase
MDSPAVSVESLDDTHVAIVRLERPPHNFVDLDGMRALADAFDQLATDGHCRAVVLTSVGRHFCAGVDLAATHGEPGPDGPIATFYREAERYVRQPLPVVAAVHGKAVGGGFGLALAADVRVVDDTARFVPNFARLGFHHGFGMSVTLPEVCGQARARHLLLSAGEIDAASALALGIADRSSAAEELIATAVEVAADIASNAPLATRSIRETMRAGLVQRFSAALERERHEQERLVQTHDFRVGIVASRKGTTPEFAGR